MEVLSLAFFENCVERATALAATCGWLAFGGGIEAAVGVAIGSAGLAAVVSDAVRRHGPESEVALQSIRERIATDLHAYAQSERWDNRADLEAADAAMERALAGCFLDRRALAASARSPLGFPDTASKLILAKLAEREPGTFGDDAPRISRDFAKTVILAALEAAIENEQYFKNIQPHLLMETLRGIGAVEERVDEIHDVVTRTHFLVSALHAEQEARSFLPLVSSEDATKQMTRKQDLLLMKQIHSEIQDDVMSERDRLVVAIVDMVSHYKLVHYPDELLNAPWDALVHISSFVCDFEQSPDDHNASALELIKNARIGSDTSYETFLKLQYIEYCAGRLWDMVKEVYENIDVSVSGLYQFKWESSNKIHWLWHQYALYSALERKLMQAVVDGQIEVKPDILRHVLAAKLNPSEELVAINKRLEQKPWSLNEIEAH